MFVASLRETFLHVFMNESKENLRVYELHATVKMMDNFKFQHLLSCLFVRIVYRGTLFLIVLAIKGNSISNEGNRFLQIAFNGTGIIYFKRVHSAADVYPIIIIMIGYTSNMAGSPC